LVRNLVWKADFSENTKIVSTSKMSFGYIYTVELR